MNMHIAPPRTACRYQLSVCVGRETVHQDCPSLEIAQAAFDLFKERQRDNREAHGGIWDRQELRTVDNWRGGPARKPLPTIFDIYAKLIARGEPVSIIDNNRAAHFNDVRSLDVRRVG